MPLMKPDSDHTHCRCTSFRSCRCFFPSISLLWLSVSFGRVRSPLWWVSASSPLDCLNPLSNPLIACVPDCRNHSNLDCDNLCSEVLTIGQLASIMECLLVCILLFC